jgi:dCTP deaminase
MMLSDNDIRRSIKRKRLELRPYSAQLVRPCSICLTLGNEFIKLTEKGVVDLRDSSTFPTPHQTRVRAGKGFVLPPNELVLAATRERLRLSHDLAGMILNLSGLARVGLQVAGSSLISPGFGERGLSSITLELLNCRSTALVLYPGMRICHVVFLNLSSASTRGYDEQVGTYAEQMGPRTSEFFREFGEKRRLTRLRRNNSAL